MTDTNFTNILLIEDNPGDYLLVSEYLEEGLPKSTLLHAETLEEGIHLLENNHIDVVLLDLTLPDGFGIRSFHSIRSKAPGIPVIILTGLGDRAIALESLKIGAQDYIVKDEANTVVLVKSIQYGIERSKILAHLKKSEEQYKYLFYNNPLPMLAFDNVTEQFLMVNDAAIKHYGFTEDEFLLMTMKELQVFRDDGYTALSSNDPGTRINYTKDIKHTKKNGETIDVEIAVHDIEIEGKQACLAVIHDVTERNKARELLRDSEQMFRTISENFPNGEVAILDRNLTVLYMAGKEFHLHNVTASHFVNASYVADFKSPVREKVQENLSEVFEGSSKVFEASIENRSYMISAVPLYEVNGQINRILLASQNITEQKQNEIEREVLIERLQHNNNDLQQFSYITSHNLRSPLSNLIGIIKLMDISSITDPTTAALLKNFEECTLQLNDTVNDLINVLIIKNNVLVQKETIDLRKTFEKVLHSIHTSIEATGTRIITDFNNASLVDFNRTYMESILLNLMTNAVKYRSPKRVPEIKVWTEKTYDGIKLYFSDNGLGIDLNRHKSRIFGLYQRFHDHADSKGLGLYIVNSQVRAMGGEIDVQSEVDQGTTFILTLKNQPRNDK